MGLLIFNSCEKTFVGENPENTHINNFELLWNDFDQHYSRFIYKGIDWDSIYNVYQPSVNNDLSENQFFNLLTQMLSNLKDGHAILESEFKFYSYRGATYPSNFNQSNIHLNYLNNNNQKGPFIYGEIENDLIYIYIDNFAEEDKEYLFIDDILSTYSTAKGIIIDVRSNHGGDEPEAKTIASRFTDKSHVFKYNKYRNGPEYVDVETYESKIQPAGEVQFLKEVVVLQNRYTGSAAEDFILMMKALPNATIIGDYSSGGAGGCPLTRELPNGWIYRIPTCLQLDLNEKPFETVGIEPDIYIVFELNDETNGVDRILEEAINLLK
ncbi:S41 family peptidase [Bacteroidota bacterium]